MKKTTAIAAYSTVAQYIPVDQQQAKLVSLITSVIAAGAQSTSKFEVKQVQQFNPEYRLVALIATSIAAANQPTTQFKIKKIEKRNETNVT